MPGTYFTIQSAIVAAQPGDEVVIAQGTYTGLGNKDLDFLGKAITVRSTDPDDPAVVAGTVIDCENSGIGFTFASGEDPDSILAGVTITHGHGDAGGAVACYGSSPTFVNCVFSQNVALEGGGLFCDYSDPTLIGCTITDNTCHQPSAWSDGGGISFYYECHPVLTNCRISGNSVSGRLAYGGGLYFFAGGSLTMTNCTIDNNVLNGTERAYGGAIDGAAQTDLTLANCTIRDNSITSIDIAAGGGIHGCWGQLLAVGCWMTGNSVSAGSARGGAISFTQLTLTNCTIAGNSVTGDDARFGGVCGTPLTVGCIVWGNEPLGLPSSAAVTFSDIEGGFAGQGNIDAAPLFVDPGNGDYHLSAGSPCIDAGDPSYVPQPGETDLDGQYRLWDGDGNGVAIVDMGADEFGSYVFGDLNCDGAVDNFDLSALVLALTNPQAYAATYPHCSAVLADINHDGAVDNFDIPPFLALLARN
ncbi:MAG: right-handed parallel beta-helix repeat-containing protein [Phycisphaerae bacterium]